MRNKQHKSWNNAELSSALDQLCNQINNPKTWGYLVDRNYMEPFPDFEKENFPHGQTVSSVQQNQLDFADFEFEDHYYRVLYDKNAPRNMAGQIAGYNVIKIPILAINSIASSDSQPKEEPFSFFSFINNLKAFILIAILFLIAFLNAYFDFMQSKKLESIEKHTNNKPQVLEEKLIDEALKKIDFDKLENEVFAKAKFEVSSGLALNKIEKFLYYEIQTTLIEELKTALLINYKFSDRVPLDELVRYLDSLNTAPIRPQ